MKKALLPLIGVLLIGGLGLLINKWQNQDNNIADLRKQHEEFLENSPFSETLKLSKKERRALGIPPNKYSEREWELSINPYTGKSEPEKLFELQERLIEQRLLSKVPGEKSDNQWSERGPDNVGGRTRAIMFDPNDVTNNRVFAGGVSGGLWVNDDITDVNSAWAEVDIPHNLAISCITYDPNDTMTFYLGTGESYVFGDVNGNGVWKSTDGGVNWTKVFGGTTGVTSVISGGFAGSGNDARVTVISPAGIAGDYFGSRASFGPTLTEISGNVVRVNDGTTNPFEGCNALVNGAAINGNIALIDRGNCDFSTKVLNAQNAGALAVIVVNNVANELINMSPGDDGDLITIPCMMLTLADGQAIINELKNGVSISMNGYRNYSGYTAKPGAQHINDIKVRDLGSGNSEVYVAAGSSFYSDASPSVYLGAEDFGLYKSVDDGSNWNRLTLLTSSNVNDLQLQPNDIEIGANNDIWVSTTRDIFGDGGGVVLSSSDGTNFTLKHTVPYGERTQIAVSNTDASKVYVLTELTSDTANGVSVVYTDDAFATYTNLPLPNSKDPDIPDEDFTNGQAFYNLMLEVDPTNDAIVYVGGIDIFRSPDSGNTWFQISEAYTTTSLSKVHPDQHALVFHPTDANIAVSGNDGGLYYATGLSDVSPLIKSRNKNYNTLQFYHGSIGQEVANEKFLAGAQDNSTQYIISPSLGINSSSEVGGGDGTYSFIDKDNQYIVVSSQNGNYYYRDYATGASSGYTIDNTSSGGQFVNPAALDSENNYLYADGSTSSLNQINRYKLDTDAGERVSDTFTNLMFLGDPTALKISEFTSTNLFIGTANGKLFKVSDATGVSPDWEEITGGDFVGSISCISFGESEDEIFVTFSNYRVSNVFYTSDGGTTWFDKEGDLPDLPVKAIMMNPLNTNEVILGTDLGVWATPNFNDVNPNWYQSQNGMKDVKVTSFDLRVADNTVLATSFGRGMFTGQFTAAASTLSIENKEFTDYVKVYPTVSNGDFKISAKNGINSGGLNIYDMNGREVYASKIEFKGNAKGISLNVSSGLYIVRFVSEGKQSTHKIIIE